MELDERPVQFEDQDGDLYYFMDTENFEHIPLITEQPGDNKYYLLNGLTFELVSYQEEALSLEPPSTRTGGSPTRSQASRAIRRPVARSPLRWRPA